MSGGMERREFLRAAAIGAGLVVTASLTGCSEEPQPLSSAAFTPAPWIHVDNRGIVTVVYDRSELGQGISTGLAMLVAEELEVPWESIRIESAPVHPVFNNPIYRAQMTGGSTGLRGAWTPLREAGTRARIMLMRTAATRWQVPESEVRAVQGMVEHPTTQRRFGYGELASDAALQPVPSRVQLKPRAAQTVIGRALPRKDLPSKVNGSATYGVDVRVPGMLAATVLRPPTFAASVRTVNDAAARAVPGVRAVERIDSGVAVVADTMWAALEGRKRLVVAWDGPATNALDSAGIAAAFADLLKTDAGREARNDGNAVAALSTADIKLDAQYVLPFLAHATMEPMNCAAHVRSDGCEVWIPTQYQAGPSLVAGGGVRGVAAKAAGMAPEQVQVHTTMIGGGFGRRVETDMVPDAVELSRRLGVPIRVMWTREDDFRHDFYRPGSVHRLQAGLDAMGRPSAWRHHVVSPSIMARRLPGFVPDWVARLGGPLKGGVDTSSVEGARELPYRIPAIEVRCTRAEVGVPTGFWRSVGHSANAFVVESFIDELAAAAKQDPMQFRRSLLPDESRERRVLEKLADVSGWGTPLPAGQARGVAVHASFESVVGVVAQVTLENGTPRVVHLVVVGDCGVVVAPDMVAAQLEGGMLMGLSAALGEQVTFAKGGAATAAYADYPMLRIAAAPTVAVHLLAVGEEPGGAGEPGVPPVAPAVANALFALTGIRARALPLTGTTWAAVSTS